MKRLRLWWLKHRVKYLKEAVTYLNCSIAIDQQLVQKHEREIRRLNMELATATPAHELLEEFNASRRV